MDDVISSLKEFSFKHNLPLIATNPAFFLDKSKFKTHDILTCIRERETLNHKNRTHSNPEYYLKTHDEMVDLFCDMPEAIENTWHVFEKCSTWPKSHAPMLPSFPCEEGETKKMKLEAKNGLDIRIETVVKPYLKHQGIIDTGARLNEYRKRLEYEPLNYYQDGI